MSETATIRYVALGDSYTEATGINPQFAYPALLTKHLQEEGLPIALVANLGRAGWNTRDVLHYELSEFEKAKPTFATLLIGANDMEQGISREEFRQNFATILERMQKVLPDKQKIIIITIPDFSVTPAIKQYENPSLAYKDIATELVVFNTIIKEEAGKRKLTVVDITAISRGMENDSSLRADDQLHPSGREYTLWEEVLYAKAYDLLK